MSTESTTESRRFEAEVAQVLHLVTHSLYSHKEIFLRELVSNASDALDKLRFAAIAEPALLDGDPELRIEIEVDRDARTLTIRDNGIGMTRDEVVENIGTIARSGTRRFLEALSADQRAGTSLIGQFGVGFYSAFIVADRVRLLTRRAGEPAAAGVEWSSDGTAEYTIGPVERPGRGTEVVLHLKEGEDEFLQDWTLRGLVSKYSDHIGFPIRMRKPVDGKPGAEWETVNHASALWTRPKAELEDEDYKAFYQSLSHDMGEPLAWTHNCIEGSQSYTLLLYVPGAMPMDALFAGRDERHGLKLYVRRVFIMDAAQELLPPWLRFVRGVVDSDDLPLNVSREILQENRLVAQIRGATIKRVLDLLEKLATDEADKYARFWQAFGNVLKEGVAEDWSNRERLLRLARFASTAGEGATQSVSLDDYIARMKPGQDEIYYLTADSHAAAAGSPQLEALRARGIEVLLLSDRIDEWMTSHVHEYAGKRLRNVAKGEIDFGKLGEAPGQPTADPEAARPLVERLKSLLDGQVADVRVSRRLTDSPACLVLGEGQIALHLARLLKQAGHEVPETRATLEVNPAHPLLARLAGESDEARARDLARVVFDQAVLAEGGQLEDPAGFLRRVNALIAPAA
jgi:molecular chaperone HtpG